MRNIHSKRICPWQNVMPGHVGSDGSDSSDADTDDEDDDDDYDEAEDYDEDDEEEGKKIDTRFCFLFLLFPITVSVVLPIALLPVFISKFISCINFPLKPETTFRF